MHPAAHDTVLKEPGELSLVLGGPAYQLWRRIRPARGATQSWLLGVFVMVLLAWVPLLVLSIAEGTAWGGGVVLTFVKDVEMHARLLIAMPLLGVAEVVAQRRVPLVVRLFVDRGLIPDAARPRFDAAVAAATRLRNSVVAELLMVALVYGVGVMRVWRTHVALDVTSWYGASAGGRLQPSLAGWWMGLASLPLFQFLLLRWYFIFFIWARFLWQVSRIDLNLLPTHPDRRAGLAFLTEMSRTFWPVLLAQGTLLAGMMANRILYAGAELPAFKTEVAGTVTVAVLAVLGPLLVFTPRIVAIRLAGMRDYGTLAQRYVHEFDRKWLRRGAGADESLVGSSDIQSLADLGSSFDVVTGMGWTPFSARDVAGLVVITLLPIAPLLLTTFSVEQVVERLLRLLF